MKYVYGARKLNETNADDRSEHDHASTVEFTRCDSFPIYHRDSTLFPPSLSSFSFTSSSSSSLDVSREVATLPLPTIDAILPPPPLKLECTSGEASCAGEWINRDSLTAANIV